MLITRRTCLCLCSAAVGLRATGADAWDSVKLNPTHPTHSYLTEYAIDQLAPGVGAGVVGRVIDRQGGQVGAAEQAGLGAQSRRTGQGRDKRPLRARIRAGGPAGRVSHDAPPPVPRPRGRRG